MEEYEIPLQTILFLQINKLEILQTQGITINNAEEAKEEIEKSSSIIQDIYNMKKEETEGFDRLNFLYNDVKLQNERYEIDQEMQIINDIANKLNKDLIILEEKQTDLKKEQEAFQEKQNELENQYIKAEEKNNNLVYNLLGFLTAFSIVSAVVGVVSQINGILNLMIFIVFTMLILITTLIALHNFYENNNKKENKLQDNYFIWKILALILVILIITSGIKYILNHKENIIKHIDNKIEKVINDKVKEN